MFSKENLLLYFVCGTQDMKDGRRLDEVLEKALKAGITMFQFREKGEGSLAGQAKVDLALSLKQLCQSYGVPFIVNDDVELAQEINADGVHVGQSDMQVETFAKAFKDKIIGLSVGNFEEYTQSDLTNIDYIGVGPMFSTQSKSDAEAPVGPVMISNLRQYVPDLPMVAIGGITVDNAPSVIEGGADGLAVISAIAQSNNINETVNSFLQIQK
ncbi:thiamine phosphate synthase [Staphylococcus sp. SQ8-PEA]|uniref:Thiamine-phosphate synthase n=1 Tax=Staphylococcus marylandisciuri TaxID=2981529 RepID=A0ABT2QRF4_9STAP|nr:thiamine phosphate synthase [Staphylococcus marylandisciuri]MCU5746557.1 thiamine phosphate synthase [Staphylococcus marylandisciuri]